MNVVFFITKSDWNVLTRQDQAISYIYITEDLGDQQSDYKIEEEVVTTSSPGYIT